MAKGKRPAPFRTRKLRPSAPMVLQVGTCGRVGHRRTFQHPRGSFDPRGCCASEYETPSRASARGGICVSGRLVRGEASHAGRRGLFVPPGQGGGELPGGRRRRRCGKFGWLTTARGRTSEPGRFRGRAAEPPNRRIGQAQVDRSGVALRWRVGAARFGRFRARRWPAGWSWWIRDLQAAQ